MINPIGVPEGSRGIGLPILGDFDTWYTLTAYGLTSTGSGPYDQSPQGDTWPYSWDHVSHTFRVGPQRNSGDTLHSLGVEPGPYGSTVLGLTAAG